MNAQQQREGAALNRAAMVSLAAAMEAYIEEVFRACIPLAYDFTPETIEKVSKQLSIPHTTDPGKIRSSFLVLGVEDIFADLRWQKCSPVKVVEKLSQINQIRNRCAHGNAITVNGKPYTLTKQSVGTFLNFAQRFGERFHAHATGIFNE